MPDRAFPFFDHENFDTEAVQSVLRLNESLGRTICIARSLLDHGRQVDLAGLDRGVGLLCAKALDLPPERGKALRPQLAALLVEVENLIQTLERRQAS